MSTTLSELPTTRLVRDSMAKQVADNIRSRVLNGNYKFGQNLREKDLANEFGVSNIVVREALHILQGEGIIITDPYRSRSVFNITAEEYRDLTVARTSLECLAAYLAAKRLDAETAQTISIAASKIRSAQPADYAELVLQDLEFHQTVWRAAKNDWLYKQVNQLALPLFSLPSLHLINPNVNFQCALEYKDSWEATTDHPGGHQGLAQSILSGKPDEARNSMILHVMAYPALADLRREYFQYFQI